VTKPYLVTSWPAVLLAWAAVGAAPARVAAADVPPSPAAPPAPAAPAAPAARPDSSADLDGQLEAARRRLEQAAREVARLSAQLSGNVIDSVMPLAGPRAVIGVQLERDGAEAGARVREVSPGGPAAEAGVRRGDVVVAVNGTELKGAEPARQVVRIMREVKPDSKVSVRVMRNGKPVTKPVEIGLSTESLTEIVVGLNAGDVVVTGVINPAAQTPTGGGGGGGFTGRGGIGGGGGGGGRGFGGGG